MMGRKLDLSGLTDNEAQHVLQVVQRDMRLRKNEEERLSELKQEQDEEGSRCLLLSRQSCFNRRCCIRCCSPFTFLLNPKQQCRDCLFNVCKACRVYSKRDKAWLCSACQKSRLLKTQSLEWFYTNVKSRFKRFGSAEVLKTLYRKHLAEQGGCDYEGSIGNECSVSESDSTSTFYRQTEEHSMDETLTVALRVAEEAVDEAISKAETDTSSQEKQNEALYLREHRGELVEELAKTIMQKIISRRRKSVMDLDKNWPLEHNLDLHHHLQSVYDQACSSFKHQPELWRSNSAFSLLDNDSPGLVQESQQALKKEGGSSGMSAWKSVDRLDNSVLKSPDGNWIALQSAQLSRPSLLTRRKSLAYSALEMESGVVSAYEGLGSDNEAKPEPDSSWLSVLQEIHQKTIDSNSNPHDTEDDTQPMDHLGSGDDQFSDSEDTWKPNRPLLARLNRKLPAEIRRSASTRPSIIDVNFNEEAAGDESGTAVEPKDGKVRKSQKRRKSKKVSSPVPDYSKKDMSKNSSDTLTSGDTTPEPFNLESDLTVHEANQAKQEFMLNLQQLASRVSDSSTTDDGLYGAAQADDDDAQSEGRRRRNKDKNKDNERLWWMETGLDDGTKGEEEEEEKGEEMKDRLYRLVAQARLACFSSTDDELDRAGLSEGEGHGQQDEDVEKERKEQEEDKMEGFTSALCRLEKEVRATQFSSTEDELDRVGVTDEERKTGEEEKLAVKVYRLAKQMKAAQFSSTEDELDGRDEDVEEVTEQFWKPQAQRAVDSAGPVSAAPISSTEDEPDQVRDEEGGPDCCIETDEEKPIEDLNVKMFDSREEIEARKYKRSAEEGETATTPNVLDCQIKLEDVKPVKTKIEVFKGTGERQEMQLKTVLGAERREDRAEEVMAFHVTRVGLENPPEAKWSDKKDGEERREDDGTGGGDQAPGKWETASDSEEEDEEFDRIISSMLMLTLEDMQVDAFKETAEEQEAEEADSKVAETGENRTERTVGDVPAKQGSRDATDPQEEASDAARGETDGEEVGDEKGDAKCDGDAVDGECESKDTEEETKEKQDTEKSCTPSLQEGLLSPQEIQNRYSAVSLRSITTEVLKVLNATEELLQGAEGGDAPHLSSTSLPPNMDPKKLDQQFSRLEENVYVAAGTVYSLEAELSDLEECARGVCSATSDMELSFLEEQVASAAAKVQQSELQICDISSRIAALKSAGLNVDPQSSIQKTRAVPVMPITLDSSRQLRRRLPAPPVKEDKET